MSSVHSPTFPSLHLCHSSFSNPSIALPMSQLMLLPFCCFTYITTHSPTLLLFLLHHRIFTYVTWRATHDSTFIIVVHSSPLAYRFCLIWSIHLNLGLPNDCFQFFILISNALLGSLSTVICLTFPNHCNLFCSICSCNDLIPTCSLISVFLILSRLIFPLDFSKSSSLLLALCLYLSLLIPIFLLNNLI